MMTAPSDHVEVTVIRKTPVPDVVTEDRITDLVKFCLVEERASGPWQVAIAFVDEGEIGLLHDQFMGDPSPTDIITFPYDDPDFLGGDIAICVSVAAGNAQVQANSLSKELGFLVLHGLLHLLDYDDTVDDDRAAMLARQQVILDKWLGLNR
jgi:probable rRNA maturation factor